MSCSSLTSIAARSPLRWRQVTWARSLNQPGAASSQGLRHRFRSRSSTKIRFCSARRAAPWTCAPALSVKQGWRTTSATTQQWRQRPLLTARYGCAPARYCSKARQRHRPRPSTERRTERSPQESQAHHRRQSPNAQQSGEHPQELQAVEGGAPPRGPRRLGQGFLLDDHLERLSRRINRASQRSLSALQRGELSELGPVARQHVNALRAAPEPRAAIWTPRKTCGGATAGDDSLTLAYGGGDDGETARLLRCG